MATLTARGSEIGSWGSKKPGFYSPVTIFDASEKLRAAGYEALNTGKHEEAYVLLLRFTRFYELIHVSKPDKSSPSYKTLQRHMVRVGGRASSAVPQSRGGPAWCPRPRPRPRA